MRYDRGVKPAFLLCLLVVGCGGVPRPSVSEGVNPSSVMLRGGESQQFIYRHNGATITDVTWSAQHGSIDSKGRYTAPGGPGEDQVTGSISGRSDTATVVIE